MGGGCSTQNGAGLEATPPPFDEPEDVGKEEEEVAVAPPADAPSSAAAPPGGAGGAGAGDGEEGDDDDEAEQAFDDAEEDDGAEEAEGEEADEELDLLFELDEGEDDEGKGEELTFAMEDVEGEEFMAVKPWIGAIKEPTDYTAPDDANELPESSLTLARVHGYRCRGVYDNVHHAATGELVYPAAAIAVIANKGENTQRFYNGHRDDIISLALDPTRTIAATGGKAAISDSGRSMKPAIHIWNVETGEQITVIRNAHKRAVPCLAFSPDGAHLVCVGADNDHMITVHDASTGAKLASAKTGTDKIIAVAWNKKTGFITTAGVKHCTFWKFNGSGFDRPKKGLVGRRGKRCTQYAIAFSPGGRTWTGTAGGRIYCYSGNKLAKNIKAHSGRVTALAGCDDYMVSGGTDGKVKFWTARGKAIGEFDIGSTVRALSIGPDGRVACGTSKSEVFDIAAPDLGDVASAERTLVHSGHYDGETWAMAPNFDGDLVLTGGDDNQLVVWNLTTHERVRSRIIAAEADKAAIERAKRGGRQSTMSKCAPNQCCRAADWGPVGLIAVGTNDGRVLVLDEADLSTVAEAQVSEKSISVVKFDPTGDYIAIGAHDSTAYIYKTEGLERVSKCGGNSSYITHLDWDEGGLAIQTTSGAYELLFYTAETGEQETSGGTLFRDEPWNTFTCTLGWPVQGIWPKFSKGSDINTLDRSMDKTLLAVGDDSGRIRLFRYPCLTNAAKARTSRGHASHLTNIRFTGDGGHVVSVGGNDNTLIVWSLA